MSVFNAGTREGLAGLHHEAAHRRWASSPATAATPRARPGSARAEVWTAEPREPRGPAGREPVRPRHPRGEAAARRSAPGVVVVVGDRFRHAGQGAEAVVAAHGQQHLQPAGHVLSPARPRPAAPAPALGGQRLVAEPLGQPAALADLAQPLLGALAQLARGHHEQVVAVPQDGTALGHQRARPRGSPCETDAPWGSRSSPTSTPCIRETGLIVTWSRSAATRSSGAASISSPRGSERRATLSTRATSGSVGPVSSV